MDSRANNITIYEPGQEASLMVGVLTVMSITTTDDGVLGSDKDHHPTVGSPVVVDDGFSLCM